MKNYEYVKTWRAKNKDKVLEQAKRYREKHPETNIKAKKKYRMNNLEKIRENDRISQNNKRKKDPEGYRRRYLKWKNKKELELQQKAGRPRPNVCEVCNEFNRQIVFDHCHKTENFRGWICDRCNKVLGLLKDNVELFKNLATYLERFNEQVNIQSQKEDTI
jgi:hypothetical protein